MGLEEDGGGAKQIHSVRKIEDWTGCGHRLG